MDVNLLTVGIILGVGIVVAVGVWRLEVWRRRRQAEQGERPDP